MRDHLLFIDTECTGWPKNWNAPYSKKNNWPYCVQISWIIYNKNGIEIKRADHYINDSFKIAPASLKIHGITNEFLALHGEKRLDVMMSLSNDIMSYQPMMIGHFMELDMHMIGAEFYREEIPDPTTGVMTFCTMKASASYAVAHDRKYLRLSELYKTLFNTDQPGQHNALSDAQAAASCFFELLKRGEIDDLKIEEQQIIAPKNREQKTVSTYTILGIVLLIIAITTLIICLSWIHS